MSLLKNVDIRLQGNDAARKQLIAELSAISGPFQVSYVGVMGGTHAFALTRPESVRYVTHTKEGVEKTSPFISHVAFSRDQEQTAPAKPRR